MQMSLTDSDNISKHFKNHNLRPNSWQNSWEVGLAPPKNLDHWRFRCNSFWFVEVLENGNYCILFVVFLSFKSCTTWSDYLVHGRNISKQLQISWNHFRNFLLQKTHYFLERTRQILTPSNVSAARSRLLPDRYNEHGIPIREILATAITISNIGYSNMLYVCHW